MCSCSAGRDWLSAVRDFYRTLRPEGLVRLVDVYHPEVVFSDPAGQVVGLSALERHFARLMREVALCECVFSGEVVGEDGAVLMWRMTLRAPGLNGGKSFAFDGVSYLQAQDGLVVRHRDYFDLGAMVYERLPVLGAVVRRVKRRLAPC